jgi:hypothetical protein
MKKKEVQDKIIELVSERERVFLTEIPRLIPEIEGEFAMYMSVVDGINPNILWVSGVIEDFPEILHELLVNGDKIRWQPADLQEMLFNSKPIYTKIPIATLKMAKTKKECWLPVEIVKVSN